MFPGEYVVYSEGDGPSFTVGGEKQIFERGVSGLTDTKRAERKICSTEDLEKQN